MEDILTKINKAYEKGISDPRFQKAINEMVKEQNPKTKDVLAKNMEDREV